MNLTRCLVRLFLFCSGIGLVHLPVFAGIKEVMVRSQHGNNDVYVVAVKDPESPKESKLSPGLYVVSRMGKNNLTPILKGEVLGVSRGFSGVLAQLKITKYTDRNEAAAVVDGKVVLFSTRSKQSQKDSYIVLGSQQNPILDVTNTPFNRFPEITDINDVSIYTDKGSEYDSEFILVSVRHQHDRGSGFTLVGELRKPPSDQKAFMQPVRPFILIDNEFYSPAELRRLVYEDEDGVQRLISPLHLSAHAAPQVNDELVLKQWRQILQRIVKNIRGKKAAPLSTANAPTELAKAYRKWEYITPFYSVRENRIEFVIYPHDTLIDKPLSIIQRMNPLGEGSGILISEETTDTDLNINRPPDIMGRVDFDSHTNEYKVYPVSAENHPAVLIYVNGRAHLVFRNQRNFISSLDVSTLIPPALKRVQISLQTFTPPNSSLQKLFFFVSYDSRVHGPRTLVLEIEDRDGIAKFVKALTLKKKYLNAKELVRRIHSGTITVEDGIEDYDAEVDGNELTPTTGNLNSTVSGVFFDDITSFEKLMNYRFNPDSITTPLIDVGASNENRPTQRYINAIGGVNMIRGELQFRRYNPTGASTLQTGFYFMDRSKDPMTENFVPGDLLRLGNNRGPFLIAKKRLQSANNEKAEQGNSSYRPYVMAFAVNPNPAKKEQKKQKFEGKFSLGIYVTASESRGRYPNFLKLIDIPADFTQLLGGHIVQGRRGRHTSVTVLLFFKNPAERVRGSRDKGGVYAVSFDVGAPERLAHSEGEGINQKWLQREEVPTTVIKHRIKFDTPGDAYWATTDDRPIEHQNFAVIRLSDEESAVLYPNRPGTRMPPLRRKESFEDDDWGTLFMSQSHWLIYQNIELSQRYPWFKEYLEERVKNEGGARQKKEASLFPHFERFLETRAEPVAERQHEVLLVEPELKDFFLKNIMSRLVLNTQGKWSLANKNGFQFYIWDPTANYREMRHNLDLISRQNGRNMLFVDLGELLTAQGIELVSGDEVRQVRGEEKEEVEVTNENDDEDDDKGKEEAEAETEERTKGTKASFVDIEANDLFDDEGSGNEEQFPTSRLMALSVEGDRVTIKGYKSRTKTIKKIPMLILSTPEEWQSMKDNFVREYQSGLFDSFKVNTQFLTSSWSVWAPQTGRASPEIKALAQNPISKEEYNVFPKLENLLREAATKGVQARHRLIIVPEEIKPLARKLVMSRWATARKIDDLWTQDNHDLALFQINQAELVTQESLADNFSAMRGANEGRRPVLVGDMSDILSIGRPKSEYNEGAFQIRDPAAGKAGAGGLTTTPDDETQVMHRRLPHLMWWLAAEGKEIQPTRTRDWKISDQVKPTIPMLIFATEKELAQLNQDADFEGRFLNLVNEFEVETLETPTTEAKYKLIEDLFLRNNEIASLRYQFEYNGLPQDEARRQLIYMMVNRVGQIAHGLNREPTSAFLHAYTKLRKTLTENSKVRQKRLLDKNFFERMYITAFPVQISFEVLDDDDYLRKLKDTNRATLGLQEHGFEGSPDPRRHIIDTMASQTRSFDEGRPVPSSMIIYGGTSSGKTFLAKTLISYLGLKYYDFNRPQDEGAGAMHIPFKEVIEADDASAPNKLSADKVLLHAENFLANNPRGVLLLDDFHNAPAKVRMKFISWLSGFFEAKKGVVIMRKLDGKLEEIPVRNISLIMTLNPQKDREIQERYLDKEEDSDNLVKLVLASIAGDGVEIEDSFIARWSNIINMDSFPREAKSPALVSRVRKGNLDGFNGNSHLLLVAPEVVDGLVDKVEDANAREFLTPATNAILGITASAQPAPLYILKATTSEEDRGYGPSRHRRVDAIYMQNVIRELTVLRPVTLDNVGSQVDLASFLIDGFRTHVYQNVIRSAQRDERLSYSAEPRAMLMAPLLMAVMNNLIEHKSVPMSLVRIGANEFMARNDRDLLDFNEALLRNSRDENHFFKVSFHTNSKTTQTSLDEFMGKKSYQRPELSRADVMTSTAQKLQGEIEKLLRAYLQIDNLPTLDVASWASQLNEKWEASEKILQQKNSNDKINHPFDPRRTFRDVGANLITIYRQFAEEIRHKEVLENRMGGPERPVLLEYDMARLFLMSLDKALTQVPWGRYTRFMAELVDTAAKDLSFGMSPAMQHFLFKSIFSPFGTVLPESIIEVARTSEDLVAFERDPQKSRLAERFNKVCSGLLEAPRRQ